MTESKVGAITCSNNNQIYVIGGGYNPSNGNNYSITTKTTVSIYDSSKDEWNSNTIDVPEGIAYSFLCN